MGVKTEQGLRHNEKASGPNFSGDSRQAIADQMEALAIELRSLADGEMQVVPTELTLLALAKTLYTARRKIDHIFEMSGFAVSPGWDFMLDLYQARTKASPISVSSACIGAACPPTTGLRWLQALEGMQLIERSQDPTDGRRTTVKLTEKGLLRTAQALQFYLKS